MSSASSHFSERLVQLGACDAAVAWARTMPDVETAYAQCRNGQWLVWLLSTAQKWPRGLRTVLQDAVEPLSLEYESILKPFDDGDVAECKMVTEKHHAALQSLHQEIRERRQALFREADPTVGLAELYRYHRNRQNVLNDQYLSEIRSARFKWSALRQPAEDQYLSRYADIFRSVVPVQVVLRAVSGHYYSYGTWLDPEECAYPHGGMTRKGLAVWPDGKLRAVRAGISERLGSIPACGRYRGTYVSGFLTVEESTDRDKGGGSVTERWFKFNPLDKYKELFRGTD